jgi:hypothetical protein
MSLPQIFQGHATKISFEKGRFCLTKLGWNLHPMKMEKSPANHLFSFCGLQMMASDNFLDCYG